MVDHGFFTLVLICFQIQGQTAIIPLPVERETGCYGNTADDFLEPQCNGSKIAVSKVFAMTKKIDTGCPFVATALDRDEAKCCTVSSDDCQMVYTTQSQEILQRKCTGLEGCQVPIAWMPTSCNTTEFIHRSNYMLLEYHCIPDSLILTATLREDGVTSGRAVYLQNSGYPSGSDIGGVCSVTSSCKTTLAITVIHMNVAGDCDHVIQVADDGEDKYISCRSNNDDDYVLADVYYSRSHFLVLTLTGAGATVTGSLWIQVRGLNLNATMDLRCGTSAVSVPPDVDVCPVEFQETTSSSVTSPTLTDPPHPNPSISPTVSTPSSAGSPDSAGSTIGITVGVAVSVIVLIAVCIIGRVICRKMKKSKVTDGQPSLEDSEKSGVLGETTYQYDDLVLNEDGLPHYMYTAGGKPGVLEQRHPLQTRLLIRSEVKPPLTPQHPVRVSTGLRRFGQGSKTVYSGTETLPIVRGPKQTQVSQDSSSSGLVRNGSVSVGTVYPNSLINVQPRRAVPDNEVPQPTYEDEQGGAHEEKRKKKKKKRKAELDNGDPNKTKKRKKKKKKDKTTTED